MQYVNAWIFQNSTVTVAHGVLAGRSWESVGDAYAALLVMLSKCLSAEVFLNVAVVVRRRWCPQECVWLKTATGRQPKPVEGGAAAHEQFSFTIVLRDRSQLQVVQDCVLDSLTGITVSVMGPHIFAWASQLDRAQEFAKFRRFSEVQTGYIKVTLGDFGGVEAVEILAQYRLQLSGEHTNQALLQYITHRTE